MRWAGLIQLRRPILTQLTRTEARAYLAWKLAQPDDALATPKARERALDEMTQLFPDYPRPMAEAMFALDHGERARAVEIMSRYANHSPDSDFYRQMLENLQQGKENVQKTH